MGRRPLKVGELGSVTYSQVAGGVLARGRTRDAGGIVRRPQFTAATEELALAGLREEALQLAFGVDSIDAETPLSALLALWIEDRDGEVRPQSLRIYKDTVRWLVPIVGAVPIGEMRPVRVKRLLGDIEKVRGEASLHHARRALNGAFGIAVEDGALDSNPLLSLRKRRGKPKMPKALTVEQVEVLRAAIARREERVARYTGTSVYLLGWVVEVMLASGLRVSEVLALRHRDIDWEQKRIEVTGTLIDEEDTWHLIRQEELKGRGQARYIEIPSYGIAALSAARKNATTIPSRQPDMPAIQGQATGKWVSARNIRRSLRDLRETDAEFVKALAASGLEPTDVTPHTLRRTAATLVAERLGDLREAQKLLGHSSESTTKRSYLGKAFRVVGSAAVLDDLLGKVVGDTTQL